jgi:hypothetical protein
LHRFLVLVLAAVSSAAAAVAAGSVDSAHACAILGRGLPGVETDTEKVLLVWDRVRRREHFVRSVRFAGPRGASFGFLVPTPARPELAEAPDIFPDLGQAVLPKIIENTEYRPVWSCMGFFKSREVAQSAPLAVGAHTSAVEVVEERRIAGMEATVLFGRDAAALSAWLGEHGFTSRPALEEWLAPYVQRAFYVTAFRYATPGPASADASDDAGARVGATEAKVESVVSETKTVRLSFDADVPFYPYREPDDVAPREGRKLDLFVVSDTPLAAQFEGGQPFVARPGVVRPLEESRLHVLRGALPSDTPTRSAEGSGALWLSHIVDRSMSRKGLPDLEFTALPPQVVEPPPIVRYVRVPVPVPIEAFALLAVGGGVVWWRRRRGVRSARH